MKENSQKKCRKRSIYVSDKTEKILQKIRARGKDDTAFAGMLLEMAMQMVKRGYIQLTADGLECDTVENKVTMKVIKRRKTKARATAKVFPAKLPYRQKMTG